MESVLAQYFHKDGTVALFNGTNNYSLDKIKLAFREKQNILEEISNLFFAESSNCLR